jgi:hypothetical protein
MKDKQRQFTSVTTDVQCESHSLHYSHLIFQFLPTWSYSLDDDDDHVNGMRLRL